MYFEFAVLFYITFTLRKNDRNMKKRILFLIAVYFWFFICLFCRNLYSCCFIGIFTVRFR